MALRKSGKKTVIKNNFNVDSMMTLHVLQLEHTTNRQFHKL